MWQGPRTGNTHFYRRDKVHQSINQSVSMPSHGQHSFLRRHILLNLPVAGCVNALARATLISTCCRTAGPFWISRSVNALARATLISMSMPSHGQHSFLLYPFKTLYFMRKTDPLFAGNSQNILKKAFFWGFTRMFTICSYLSILSNLFLPLSIHSDYTIIYAKKTGTPTEINSPKPPLPLSIRRSYFQ